MYGQPFGSKSDDDNQKKTQDPTNESPQVEQKKEEVRLYPDYSNPDPESLKTKEGNETKESTESSTSDLPSKEIQSEKEQTPDVTNAQEIDTSLPSTTPIGTPPTSPVTDTPSDTGVSDDDSFTHTSQQPSSIEPDQKEEEQPVPEQTVESIQEVTESEPSVEPISEVTQPEPSEEPLTSESDLPSTTPTQTPPDDEEEEPLEDLSQLEPEPVQTESDLPSTTPAAPVSQDDDQDVEPEKTVESLDELESPTEEEKSEDPGYKLPGEDGVDYSNLTEEPEAPAVGEPIKIPEAPNLEEISKQVEEASEAEVQPQEEQEPVQKENFQERPDSEVQPQSPDEPLEEPKGVTIREKLSAKPSEETQTFETTTEKQIQPLPEETPVQKESFSETLVSEVQPQSDQTQPISELDTPINQAPSPIPVPPVPDDTQTPMPDQSQQQPPIPSEPQQQSDISQHENISTEQPSEIVPEPPEESEESTFEPIIAQPEDIPQPSEEQPPQEVQPDQTPTDTPETEQTPPQQPEPPEKSGKKLKTLNKTLSIAKIFGFFLLIGAVVLVSIPSLPYLWYRVSNGATAKETESISGPATEGGDESFAEVIEEESGEADLPEFDGSLPYYNTLIISGIGVNGVIHQGDDPQAALEDGIWMVPELGTPEEKTTTILAAHRFGYITWDNEFRTKNSFYNLPKTEVGDAVEIVWNQRKYEYEIYKTEEGIMITDYDADLILYTCKLFNTPVRIFRYANRVN